MINIYVNEPQNLIKAVDSWFDRNKTKDWFNRQDVKDVIKIIDKTDAIKDEYLESPIFGAISPDKLSTGCKALILMLIQDRPVYATKCGDNCIDSIVNIGEKKDISICLHHPMKFPTPFKAYMIDTGVIVNSRKEFLDEYYKVRSPRQ